MDQPANPQFLADVTGALDWWREAGVDCDFLDEAREWLAETVDDTADGRAAPPRRRPPPRPAEDAANAAPVGVAAAELPDDLAAFQQWWLNEPLLDGGSTSGRVAPAGSAGCEVMVIVEMPEAEDRETLLSGPQGRLLDAILAAIGLSREQVYLASALPRAMPSPDWAEAQAHGLGRVLLHHVGLVAPKRLFTLGVNVLPLLGHESPRRTAISQNFNHEGATIPLLASWGLASLLNHPGAKPVLWKAMLEWSAD